MSEQKLSQKLESVPTRPESGWEKSWERPEPKTEVAKSVVESLAPVMPAPTSPTIRPNNDLYKDAQLVEIERVLEQDLEQIYFDLPQEAKLIFKNEGELTARKIGALMKETKVTAQKVLELILAWLSLLPGVNRFFVEQEAKIKADRILALKNYE